MPDRPEPNVPPTVAPDDKTLAETVIESPPTSTGDGTRGFTVDGAATVTDDSTYSHRTRGRVSQGEEPDLLPPGTVIEGKYEVLTRIGTGGMGSVYRAKHRSLNREVALKVMKPDFARNREAVERFKREAQLCAMVEHPNSIRVFDHGVENGMCFLVMELLHGQTLGDRLTQRGALPTLEAVGVADRILLVLALLHRKGIVHRDLKPDNIFFAVSPDHEDDEEAVETVKLLDFGIAKQSQTDGPVTHTGAIVGTPFYMSPEQCEGRTVDHRSDIYSLGVILFEMLSGKPPFGGSNLLGVLYQHVNNPPPNLRERAPNVPEAVVAVIERMLEKEPDKRFQKASEAAAALCGAAGIESVRGGATLTPEAAERSKLPLPTTPKPELTPPATIVVEPGRPARKRLLIGSAAVVLAALALFQFAAPRNFIGTATYAAKGVPAELPAFLDSTRKATLERSILMLTDHLGPETQARRRNPNAWTMAQMTVGVVDRAAIPSASIVEFLETNSAADSWYDSPGAPPHVVVSGWVAIAMARLNHKMRREQLEFFLKNQHPDGWWTLYVLPSNSGGPTILDRDYASTYATAMATLGLHEQLLIGIEDPALAARVKAAVKAGRDWLFKTRIPDQARWHDYPSNDGRRVLVGVSGLVMHVLHRTETTVGVRGDMAAVDVLWLDSLPDVPLDAKNVESTLITLTLNQREDTTKQYPLQWSIIATVDAYPNGGRFSRARALVWITPILDRLDTITPGVVGKTDWVAAEWLIALRKLNGEKPL
jgi:serine/threonine protein kinase